MEPDFHFDDIDGGMMHLDDGVGSQANSGAGGFHSGPLSGMSAQLGDAMDVDPDFDPLAWATEFDDHAAVFPESSLHLPDAYAFSFPVTGLPPDPLFAEDEGPLPVSTSAPAPIPVPVPTITHSHDPPHTGPSVSPGSTASTLHANPHHADARRPMHSPVGSVRTANSSSDTSSSKHPDMGGLDVARERLRRQLSLLSKGWAGDEIRFKNCDRPKAMILHNFAMELRLGYRHDVQTHEVSICRTEPPAGPQPVPRRVSPSGPRSSTELDSTRCLPETPPFSSSISLLSLPEVDGEFSHEFLPPPRLAQHNQQQQQQQQQPPHQHQNPELQHRSQTEPEHEATIDTSQLLRHASRSERISDSISKHVSTIKTSISKGGRRGPLSENGRRDMRALEAAGGACWRCKVLRRKCDPRSTCRCCLQSVPMVPMPGPLGEDGSLWPLIGCRRGHLRDSLPVLLLCPESQRYLNPNMRTSDSVSQRSRSADMVERCLLSAESQRLADMKAVFEGSPYKLSIGDESLKESFFTFIEAGRYRDSEPLHKDCTLDGKTATYAELIPIIAWELAENSSLLSLLEIRSWKSFMGMLETACIYESEVGQTSLVMISIVCLRRCLEALRLHSANLLSTSSHESCSAGQCRIECIQNLSNAVAVFTDELSSVVFNKDNMRDRRWWLSTFYSLLIQSFVRHALITIERQLRFRHVDDDTADDPTSGQYLHLATVLFTAASAKYDPLLGGRLQYALTEGIVVPETSVPEGHHASAREACEVDKWPEMGIKTSYQFLRQLLQIGSLDFEPATDLGASRASSRAAEKAVAQTPHDPALSPEGLPSPKQQQRQSFNSISSRYSGPSFSLFSNQSSDSLTHTLSTDVTSLYENSILGKGTFSDGASELDVDVAMNMLPMMSAFSSPPGCSPSTALAGPSERAFSFKEDDEKMAVDTLYVCNCCPKAPRKFQTAEELALHEAEKPHPCSQCKKRFKSPTEADRHINAIHSKSDSWSCKALEDPLRAFYSETFNGVVWDICGFCGGFARLREGDLSAGAVDLVAHLESVHKVGECDRNKKFYRGDNFRQHLKNTHVAKTGKWLKVLERVCRNTQETEAI